LHVCRVKEKRSPFWGTFLSFHFYLFITVLVRTQAVAAALQVGIQPHMQHLEKFPIIFGGDLISMNMLSKEGFQGFGVLGALKESLSEFG
jgi:hypothetical protein